MEITRLEQQIGYSFCDKRILRNALTHSSYANEKHMEKKSCNERLEFLGDAVLELVSSEFLFNTYSDMQEGAMTKFRASLVCEPSLASCARKLNLGELLYLGKGEDATGGRTRDSILSDALEAVIGAIYLDGGFANAKEFIRQFVLTDIDNKQLFYDSKTILQEMVQGQNNHANPIRYHLIGETGPDHNKEFTVQVLIEEEVYGTGCGHSKKGAEQEAAYQAILRLKAEAEISN